MVMLHPIYKAVVRRVRSGKISTYTQRYYIRSDRLSVLRFFEEATQQEGDLEKYYLRPLIRHDIERGTPKLTRLSSDALREIRRPAFQALRRMLVNIRSRYRPIEPSAPQLLYWYAIQDPQLSGNTLRELFQNENIKARPGQLEAYACYLAYFQPQRDDRWLSQIFDIESSLRQERLEYLHDAPHRQEIPRQLRGGRITIRDLWHPIYYALPREHLSGAVVNQLGHTIISIPNNTTACAPYWEQLAKNYMLPIFEDILSTVNQSYPLESRLESESPDVIAATAETIADNVIVGQAHRPRLVYEVMLQHLRREPREEYLLGKAILEALIARSKPLEPVQESLIL